MSTFVLPALVASRQIRRPGRLSGTTEQPPSVSGPQSVPAPRRIVQIFEREIGFGAFLAGATLVEVVLSNDAGEWSSPLLSRDRVYAAVAYDTGGQYDPAIKTNLIPDPL